MSLEENVKKWVEYDTLIRLHSDKIKELRNSKCDIEKNIHSHISNYNKKPIINISDGVLKFSKVNIQQTLSYKLIENSIQNIISNKEKVEEIMKSIRSNRTSKEVDVIKRYYR